MASEAGLPVAIDAMGGDHAPDTTVAGAIEAAKRGVPVVLVGDEGLLRERLPRRPVVPVIHASETVGMDEPASVVRRRDDASMRVALRLVAEGRACAALSCGHSGALLFATVLELGTLDGVERPAIATNLPRSDGGQLVLLDAGANVDCRSEQLASFALLGSAYARTLGLEHPRVGLLSNGEESGKGNEQVRAAHPLLQALPVDFVGNVEPSGALAGACDVLVCDGFVGNVMIKAVEGAATTVVQLLKEEIRRHPLEQAGAWLMQRAFRRFARRVAWESHGGGILLGSHGVVVVGHGRANGLAVRAGAELGWHAARQELVAGMERGLARDRLG